MRQKLTPFRLSRLKPLGSGSVFVWDEGLPGFGVRLGRTKHTYLVQYRNRAGRSRRLTLAHYPATSLPEARRRAAEILAAVDRGEDPAAVTSARVPTLREFSATYLSRHARVHKRARSIAGDEYLFDTVLLPAMGDRSLDAIDRRDVQRLHGRMSSTPHFANRAVALLSTVFACAAEWGETPAGTNPAKGIRRYPEPPRERWLSEAELARLGGALRRAEMSQESVLGIAALRLLLFTGARKREVTGLRWSEVDIVSGCLRLPAERCKEKRPKTIPLAPPALQILTRLPHLNDERVFPAVRESSSGDFHVDALWYRVRRDAGLEDVRLHDLRHTAASAGIGAGLSLHIIGRLLGHTRPQTTSRYAHLDPDPIRRAANVIGTRLAAALDARSEEPRSSGPSTPARLAMARRVSS